MGKFTTSKKISHRGPNSFIKTRACVIVSLQYSTKKLSCLLSNLRKDKVFFSSFRKSLYTLDKVIKTIENLNNPYHITYNLFMFCSNHYSEGLSFKIYSVAFSMTRRVLNVKLLVKCCKIFLLYMSNKVF